MLSSLVAVDRDLESSFALRVACQISGRIRPIHVLENPNRDLAFGSGWARKSWEQDAVDQARQSLGEFITAERHQCPALEETLVVAGDPVFQVEGAFRALSMDLLIVGLPFRGLQAHGLCRRFSQQAEKAHLEIPALLVRGLGPMQKICALTDGSKWAEDALGLLARLEPTQDREITLIGISSPEHPEPDAEQRQVQRGAAILQEKGVQPAMLLASQLGEDAVLEHLRLADLVVCPLPLPDKGHQRLAEFCESRCRALLVILGRPEV